MKITKELLKWCIEYRGGMGNRIDAFDILDLANNKGYLYEAYKEEQELAMKCLEWKIKEG